MFSVAFGCIWPILTKIYKDISKIEQDHGCDPRHVEEVSECTAAVDSTDRSELKSQNKGFVKAEAAFCRVAHNGCIGQPFAGPENWWGKIPVTVVTVCCPYLKA